MYCILQLFHGAITRRRDRRSRHKKTTVRGRRSHRCRSRESPCSSSPQLLPLRIQSTRERMRLTKSLALLLASAMKMEEWSNSFRIPLQQPAHLELYLLLLFTFFTDFEHLSPFRKPRQGERLVLAAPLLLTSITTFNFSAIAVLVAVLLLETLIIMEDAGNWKVVEIIERGGGAWGD